CAARSGAELRAYVPRSVDRVRRVRTRDRRRGHRATVYGLGEVVEGAKFSGRRAALGRASVRMAFSILSNVSTLLRNPTDGPSSTFPFADRLMTARACLTAGS